MIVVIIAIAVYVLIGLRIVKKTFANVPAAELTDIARHPFQLAIGAALIVALWPLLLLVAFFLAAIR